MNTVAISSASSLTVVVFTMSELSFIHCCKRVLVDASSVQVFDM